MFIYTYPLYTFVLIPLNRVMAVIWVLLILLVLMVPTTTTAYVNAQPTREHNETQTPAPPRVLPFELDEPDPHSESESITAEDEEYKRWTEEWWQWVLPFHHSVLLLDPNGENQMKYQPEHGNEEVFFLTGAYNASQVRNVTIPHGNAILVPVLNGVYSCGGCNIFNIFSMRDKLIDAGHVYDISYMEAKLNGDLIPYTRITSDIFDAQWTKDNPFHVTDPLIVGQILPTVSDGYWAIIEPDQLPIGEHTLYIYGIEQGYISEVLYNLKIV